MPASAVTAAADIPTSCGAAGKYSDISSMPSAALWLAPTIDGSTKRFFSRICIIIPATAIEAPVSTTAKVRGRRLIIISCISSDSENRRLHWKSATPTDRLAANSSGIASSSGR